MMLRQTSNIVKNVRLLTPVDIGTVVETPTCYQCVRWRRKPRWLPVAKSKMFRVPERPKVPEEEIVELRRLQNNYNSQVKAIRAYLLKQVEATVMTVDSSLDKEELLEEDFAHRMRINDEWNTEVAKLREERLAKEAEMMKEDIMKRLIMKEEEEKQRLEEIEKMVRKEKEKAKLYITPDNIDEAIEKALNNEEVDYNFAIDVNGNIYHGRHTKPSDVAQEDKMKILAHSGS